MDANIKLQLWQKALELVREPTDTSELLATIKDCIENGYAAEVLKLLTDDNYKEILDNIGWQLFSVLTPYANDNANGSCSADVEDIITTVVKFCKPKEIILGILEHLPGATNGYGFLNLLKHLKIALLRQTRQRVKFLQMVYDQVILEVRSHSQVYVQENWDEAACQRLPQARDNHRETCDDHPPACVFLSRCLNFAEPFIETLTSRELRGDESDEKEYTRTIVLSLITELAASPSLKSEFSSQSDLEEVANTLLDKFFQSCGNVVYFLQNVRSRRSNADTGHESEATMLSLPGLGIIFHLLFVRGNHTHLMPFILRADFLVSSLLRPIIGLLERNDDDSVRKGLALLVNTTLRIEDGSLTGSCLQLDNVERVLECLMTIAVYCEDKESRMTAVAQSPIMIAKVGLEDRFIVIRSLLGKANHSGFAGVIIHSMKDNLSRSLEDNTLELFLHRRGNFAQFLESAFDPLLEKNADVIEETDRLLAALNLVRYMLVRACGGHDEIGICKILPELQAKFLQPLRLGISRSRISHRKFLNSRANKEPQTDMPSLLEFSVETVRGEPINPIAEDERVQMIKVGLLTLDVMESVTARVFEIIDSLLPRVV